LCVHVLEFRKRHILQVYNCVMGSTSWQAVILVWYQAVGYGNRQWERAHGGKRKEMWQPDDGSAVPPELGMPGGNATIPNSRRDMQVGLVPTA
jgi:hypothetical protein